MSWPALSEDCYAARALQAGLLVRGVHDPAMDIKTAGSCIWAA